VNGNLFIRHCPCHTGKGGVAWCPHGMRTRVSAPFLVGHAHTPTRLHWGLDGALSVAPTSSPSFWCQHLDRAMTVQQSSGGAAGVKRRYGLQSSAGSEEMGWGSTRQLWSDAHITGWPESHRRWGSARTGERIGGKAILTGGPLVATTEAHAR
jgi:hypothetical protein